jgi:C-terminal processing protease CtpA/Prc
MFAMLAQQALSQKVERGEWEDILRLVSADVQKNFYDPKMKGLDWDVLTEETRQRIETSNNVGQMILAISSQLSRLHDSHTYFVPPRLTAYSDFGFKARAYGNDVRVYEIRKKGPADKAGLRVGASIVSLNGVPVDRGNIREVLRLVTSVVPATALELTFAGLGAQHQTLHIPANVITAQEHLYIDSVWRVADQQRARDIRVNFSHKDYENGVSYVGIPSFLASPEVTYSEISRARHAQALILDLRGNGGGWQESLTALLGFFTEQPDVIAKRVMRSESQDLIIKPRNSGFRGSTIVLVDSDSASAAESAARYLQLSHKAVIVGDLTSGMVNEGHLVAGKIGAQFVLPFAVMVTSAKLVMPNGEELEGHGVTPDVSCVPTEGDLIQQADPCLERALGLAKKSLPQAATR